MLESSLEALVLFLLRRVDEQLDDRGARIEVPEGTAEAMSQRAENFCRARGWRTAAYARLQTLESRTFLADVLCSDTRN